MSPHPLEKHFNTDLYRDSTDLFDTKNAQRIWYTTPVTSIPNDQESFANWLYKTPPTCKEGNGAQCIANYYTPLNGTLDTPGYGSKP